MLNKILVDLKLLNGNVLNYWKFYSAHSLGREKPGVNYTNEFTAAAVTIWLNQLTTLAKVETIPISFLIFEEKERLTIFGSLNNEV